MRGLDDFPLFHLKHYSYAHTQMVNILTTLKGWCISSLCSCTLLDKHVNIFFYVNMWVEVTLTSAEVINVSLDNVSCQDCNKK